MTEFAKYSGIAHSDAVSLGRVAKMSRVTGLGNNPDVDTGTLPEDSWSGGGLYPWMTAATALQIRSTSASDTAAGVGARTVLVPTLDTAFVPVSKSLVMNGVTAVPFVGTAYRINMALVATAGTSETNVGDLIIEDVAAPNTVRCIIKAGAGISQQAAYTVQANAMLLVKQLYLGINAVAGSASRVATLTTYTKTNGVIRLPITIQTANGIAYLHNMDPPIALTSGTDFSLRIGNLTDSNSDITGAWNGILVLN